MSNQNIGGGDNFNQPYPEQDPYGGQPGLDPYAGEYVMPPAGMYGGMNDGAEIGIIKGLSPDKILERIEVRLRGYRYDSDKKKETQVRVPIMNNRGIQNFIQILSSVSEIVTLSNFNKTEVPALVYEVIRKNLPHFYVYSEEYALSTSDFNIISTTLLTFTLASYNKAVGAGDRNVIRGTFSEGYRSSMGGYGGYDQGQPRKKGFLSFLNPFSKK